MSIPPNRAEYLGVRNVVTAIEREVVVAERLDTLLPKIEEIENVGRMSAEGEGVECRPYRSRTCDTLIKRQKASFPINPSRSRKASLNPSPKSHSVPDSPSGQIKSP